MTAEGKVIFSCHPMKNLILGRFVFEQGTLTLFGDDAEELRALLKESASSVRSRVRVVDVERANKIAKEQAKTNPVTKAKAGTSSTATKPQVVG